MAEDKKKEEPQGFSKAQKADQKGLNARLQESRRRK
jgi:hypothetical protein